MIQSRDEAPFSGLGEQEMHPGLQPGVGDGKAQKRSERGLRLMEKDRRAQGLASETAQRGSAPRGAQGRPGPQTP